MTTQISWQGFIAARYQDVFCFVLLGSFGHRLRGWSFRICIGVISVWGLGRPMGLDRHHAFTIYMWGRRQNRPAAQGFFY